MPGGHRISALELHCTCSSTWQHSSARMLRLDELWLGRLGQRSRSFNWYCGAARRCCCSLQLARAAGCCCEVVESPVLTPRAMTVAQPSVTAARRLLGGLPWLLLLLLLCLPAVLGEWGPGARRPGKPLGWVGPPGRGPGRWGARPAVVVPPSCTFKALTAHQRLELLLCRLPADLALGSPRLGLRSRLTWENRKGRLNDSGGRPDR
ncbi:hypothetical protein P7K49_035868 [Saguinus oedipus]|uniref:Uncharacterized protein n=1 Tax=Saguinus oedipus TaxID=9490 RepID=A0ABQ9TNW0_SAGOE|nr:hypothetical protein P7K49_035868 [Saguinus oedipus]